MAKLLLLNFNGARYGVWKDAVPSVISASPLHLLPRSPAVIAGITILEDRPAVIADLSACLDGPSLTAPQDGAFLLINAKDKLAGFCVEGKIEEYDCPPEHVLPLPSVVATPVVDTCAVHGASLVPIINIAYLHGRLKQGVLGLPLPEPGPPACACDLAGLRSVRVLSVGDTWFCVNAAETAYATIGDGDIAPLPVRSGRFSGVALHDGAAVPVMQIESLLGCSKAARRKGILFAGPPDARYGVAVDQDHGIVEGPDLAMLDLPKIAARPCLPAAALAKGKICLFFDYNVFATAENIAEVAAERFVFTPASQFPSRFRKTDAEIVEFSFLGTSHAVPREEMKDDLALLPFVPVPGTKAIVLGVAELQGELLPVLDLAALFGRRSPLGEKSRMLHIVNGDFQALVITAEVAGSRILPVDMQRQVPLALPHQVLYGCYLDEGVVRLVLNVEALAVHFEKIAVLDIMDSLSPEPGEGGPVKPRSIPAEHSFPVRHDIPGNAAGAAGDGGREHMAVPSEAESVRQPEEVAAREQEKQRFDADKLRAEEEARRLEREVAQQLMEAEARQQEMERLAREQARLIPEATAKHELAETGALERGEQEERTASETAAKNRTMPDQRAMSELSLEPVRREGQPAARNRGKYGVIAAVIVFLLVVLISYFGLPKRQAPQGTLILDKTGKQAATRVKALEPEKEPPLYLAVPQNNVMSSSSVYTVVKGDNLWNIALRFTGNPLNYPRVARDNSIATPDLIFPGQRIRLMQQETAGTGPQGVASPAHHFISPP